ncbi:uncharacterized protein LOC132604030 isoform X2 [Lycium barbarum]|uniref:uncharacterized protein LOC132604030 isoform X2 n=1 Tax=Lycium barbarum TaxID=112863 RepID=UPI00293EA5C3|nr:uncharacterized protein LOC132604030 isoform X2 [Lycium barbarum]
MAVASDQATSICSNCDRAILTSNLDLHVAHCSRKLEKCKICGDMVPKRHAEEHFLRTHVPVACSLCGEKMDRELLAVHKGENCPQRIVACEYCEFPLPAIDLSEHQEVCGNRTELCHLCSRYIRLRERDGHENRCNGGTNKIAESVPKRHAEDQFLSTHAQVACSLCSKTVEREVLAVHKRKNCPQRIVTCEYCKFLLPAINLLKHQEVCGNRTERCHLCSRYIRLRDRNAHENRCNGGTNNLAESSSSPAERDRGAPRRKPHEVPKPWLLFTIAITGVAVLFGSLIFQRKEDS